MATSTDPFKPTTPLSRAVLGRYLEGRSTPAEQHDVELHLEGDPFLRDAAEGLQQPGALAASNHLGRPRGGGSGAWGARLLGVSIIAVVGLIVLTIVRMPEPGPTQVRQLLGDTPDPQAPLPAPRTDSLLNAVHAEIARTLALPETLQAARALPEHFARVQRDTSFERLASRPVGVERVIPQEARPEQPARPSRQLVFLHGLKVVHPAELYPGLPSELLSPGIPADQGVHKPEPRPIDPPEELRKVAYLDFLDHALGAFVEGRQRDALDELLKLLAQYPGDVNGEFYAGLCYYDLGLLDRAAGSFELAGSHHVDTFNEEAAWYLALTIERRDGRAVARSLFEAIAREGGFYAAKARARSLP